MPHSPAHPDLTSLFSQQLSVSGSATLLRAMFNSPSALIPGAPILPWVLLVLVQSVSFPCKVRGQYQGLDLGLYKANGKEDDTSPQGFLPAGRCQSLQSCCYHSPAPLGTAESKAQGWGCFRTSVACRETSGSGLNGSASSRGIQISSSHRKTFRCFP